MRRAWRRAWGCKCEPRDRDTDLVDEAALKQGLDHWKASLEKATGYEPPECPWQCLNDAVVMEAVDAYRWFESGEVTMVLGANPPNVLVEAVGIYHAAVGAVTAHDRKLDDEKRRRRNGG